MKKTKPQSAKCQTPRTKLPTTPEAKKVSPHRVPLEPDQLTPDSLLRLAEVQRHARLSRTSIYRLVAGGQFPRPLQIGPKSIAWRWADVLRWLRNRPKAGATDSQFARARQRQIARNGAIADALERNPEFSYRQVANAFGVDIHTVYRAAQSRPGLLELRSGRQYGARGQRAEP